MKTSLKRILSVLLSVLLVFSVISTGIVSANAEYSEPPDGITIGFSNWKEFKAFLQSEWSAIPFPMPLVSLFYSFLVPKVSLGTNEATFGLEAFRHLMSLSDADGEQLFIALKAIDDNPAIETESEEAFQLAIEALHSYTHCPGAWYHLVEFFLFFGWIWFWFV
ncbi:MAG: hypothetical protein LBR73_07365 [Oscillospiraceae bacterium]|jgi:hypothetical protein|nr:hypothetical protein [Oscillospiraceae bacterium]